MNLFQKYGIKEVADVVFYTITTVGDEEIYTPVLLLDTLKVSTIEKSAENVSAEGGKGNKKLITWNFGKEITLNLEDALFSPASMSMIWGGELQAKLAPYTSAIVKINIANKYGQLHYSTKAYPSPALTDEEWEIVFKAATESKVWIGDNSVLNTSKYSGLIYWKENYDSDEESIEENRTNLRKGYYKRLWQSSSDYTYSASSTDYAMPTKVVEKIMTYITNIKKIGSIETEMYDVEVIDRMEKCIVRNKDGLTISTQEQKKNLFKYYQDDQTSSYTIYYDAKTMLPLFNLTDDGYIQGWEANYQNDDHYDQDFDLKTDSDRFKLKLGTVYYKWTRTVKYKQGDDDGILGRTLVIDAETFPGVYKIVGETYIRNQKTGKDQRYQFIIHRAQVNSDTSITLEAEGDPTTFTMSIDVLTPPNDIMMELKQFDVDEDTIHGGTRIVPQKAIYTHTATQTELLDTVGFDNPEIY
jgi:hypothetical protein